jgi:hypothetical protein
MIKKEVTMPNPRHGGIIAGLLCAAMALFLVLWLAGAIVTRTVHVHSADGEHSTNVAIDTPAGPVNIRTGHQINASLDGVPVYPGAVRGKDGRVSFDNVDIAGGEFRTKDSVSQVVEFYRRQWPSLMIVSRHDDYVRCEYKDGGFRRIVSIEEDNGETRIGVATIGDRASN